MKIFVAILEWAEWDDYVLFTSAEAAQKYVVSKIRSHIHKLESNTESKESKSMSDFLYYEIGEYSADSGKDVLHPTCVRYTLRYDIAPDTWFDMMKNPETNVSLFFQEWD